MNPERCRTQSQRGRGAYSTYLYPNWLCESAEPVGPGSVLNLFLPQQVTLVVLAGASSSANVQRCREKGWSYEFNRLNEIDRERSDGDVDAAVP